MSNVELSYTTALGMVMKSIESSLPKEYTQEQKDVYIAGYANAIWDLTNLQASKHVEVE